MYYEKKKYTREELDEITESVWLVMKTMKYDLHYILYNMKGSEIQALSNKIKSQVSPVRIETNKIKTKQKQITSSQ